jgi:hypothetical protein
MIVKARAMMHRSREHNLKLLRRSYQLKELYTIFKGSSDDISSFSRIKSEIYFLREEDRVPPLESGFYMFSLDISPQAQS